MMNLTTEISGTAFNPTRYCEVFRKRLSLCFVILSQKWAVLEVIYHLSYFLFSEILVSYSTFKSHAIKMVSWNEYSFQSAFFGLNHNLYILWKNVEEVITFYNVFYIATVGWIVCPMNLFNFWIFLTNNSGPLSFTNDSQFLAYTKRQYYGNH